MKPRKLEHEYPGSGTKSSPVLLLSPDGEQRAQGKNRKRPLDNLTENNIEELKVALWEYTNYFTGSVNLRIDEFIDKHFYKSQGIDANGGDGVVAAEAENTQGTSQRPSQQSPPHSPRGTPLPIPVSVQLPCPYTGAVERTGPSAGRVLRSPEVVYTYGPPSSDPTDTSRRAQRNQTINNNKESLSEAMMRTDQENDTHADSTPHPQPKGGQGKLVLDKMDKNNNAHCYGRTRSGGRCGLIHLGKRRTILHTREKGDKYRIFPRTEGPRTLTPGVSNSCGYKTRYQNFWFCSLKCAESTPRDEAIGCEVDPVPDVWPIIPSLSESELAYLRTKGFKIDS